MILEAPDVAAEPHGLIQTGRYKSASRGFAQRGFKWLCLKKSNYPPKLMVNHDYLSEAC